VLCTSGCTNMHNEDELSQALRLREIEIASFLQGRAAVIGSVQQVVVKPEVAIIHHCKALLNACCLHAGITLGLQSSW
jgi:hypothetical protein